MTPPGQPGPYSKLSPISCAVADTDLDSPRDHEPDDTLQRALDHALRFLAVRARSVAEVRARLTRYGYDATTIDAVIQQLEELGYLDDATFALLLARDYLDAPRPRGEFVILAKLREYGVDEATAHAALARALEDADETPHERVRRAAERWCRRLRPGDDRARAARRLYNHLARAGFDHELIRAVVEELLSDAGH